MPITWKTPSALAVMLLASACATAPPNQPPQQAQLAHAVAPPERLGPPDYLPKQARAILRQRMASHARDMGDLVSSIMVLDYEQIRERALELATDASFARPLTGDATELNAALPARFFQHQDELKQQARALAGAATVMKAFDVAEAYGQLAQTCVRCHATYRQGPQ
jgi:cytochrome c556